MLLTKLTALRHGKKYLNYYYYYCYIRGDNFRMSFSDLGQLRSTLPKIPVLAVTATATHCTYDVVTKQLAMENVVIIGMSPCQDNIFLSVKSITLADFVEIVAESVRQNNLNHPKTLIFCQTYIDCNIVYDNV